MRRTLIASLAALALAGCHVVRYDTGRPASQRVVTVPLNFFVWGLVGDRAVDLDAACPDGAARWQNQATVGDAIIDVVTLGIWSPRTVRIECAEGGTR
ncbi:MAG TPA: hypothetical protein VLT47_13335 [Anaeromyxobacteraceae bacterium]|nr:hypothetical protein [Anaeromyxobacteraceae bacterium]